MKVRASGFLASGFWLLTSVLLIGQQRDAPATPPVPVGTGKISGVVVSADSARAPMRRAVVTVTGAVPARSVVSDDAGRFTFERLPAGSFTVTARKAAYLAAPYGAKRPGRTGVPIALTDAQQVNVVISMFRGAAIAGTLRDAAGAPMPGVDVRVIDARTLMAPPDNSAIELTTTDDLGAFRLYSLRPGDYYVVALPGVNGSGEIVAPSTAAIDAALARLTSQRSGNPGASQAPSRPRAVGFSPIYYPGTASYSDSVRVHVDVAEERDGINFALSPVPMAAIDGVVRGSIPNAGAAQVTIIPSGPRVTTSMSSNQLSGKPIDAQGAFRYSNLPPGSYRLVARAPRDGNSAAPAAPPAPIGVTGGGGVSAPRPSTVDYLFGVADIELTGDDISGVALELQPGGSLSGRIVFNGSTTTARPADLSKIRASMTLEGGTGMVSSNGLMMGTGLISSPNAMVQPDSTFEIRGIGPGRFSLGVSLGATPEAASWKLRSAMAGGRDLLDDVLEFGPGADIRNTVVTFSDARTELSGSLQTPAGALTTDYYIVAMPADRALWRAKSRRILSVRPATDGQFVFTDLPAGDYLIAALEDLDPIDLTDMSFLEQVAPAGVKVRVSDGQKTVQGLQIR